MVRSPGWRVEAGDDVLVRRATIRNVWPSRPWLTTSTPQPARRGRSIVCGRERKSSSVDRDPVALGAGPPRAPCAPQPASEATRRARRRARHGGAGRLFRMLRRPDASPASRCSALPAARRGARRLRRGGDRRSRSRIPDYEGRAALRRALLRLPHADDGRHAGLGDRSRRRASTRTARTSTSARRATTRSSTRSATAASPRARCRRTSSSARRPRRSRTSSRSTRATKAPKTARRRP